MDGVHYVSTFALDNYSLTSINESDHCSDYTNSHMNYIAGSKPYFLIAAYAICFCFIKSYGYWNYVTDAINEHAKLYNNCNSFVQNIPQEVYYRKY